MTILISVLGVFFGLVIGVAVGLARLYGPRPIQVIFGVYVDAIRSVPLMVIVIWSYYALPLLLNLRIPAFLAGLLALSLHSGAYLSEVFRAGIASLSSGQEMAALALGMTRLQAFRRVIVPQAVIRMLPPVGSELVLLIKASSLVSVIAVPELLYKAATLNSLTLRPTEVFTTVGVIYFIFTFPLARLMEYIFRRLSPQQAT